MHVPIYIELEKFIPLPKCLPIVLKNNLMQEKFLKFYSFQGQIPSSSKTENDMIALHQNKWLKLQAMLNWRGLNVCHSFSGEQIPCVHNVCCFYGLSLLALLLCCRG